MNKSRLVVFPILLAAALFLTGCGHPKGLYIEKGRLYKDGRAVYAVGTNYYSLFNRTYTNRADTSGLHGLSLLAENGIPFVRFSATVYWPKEITEYMEGDSIAYWNNMDAVVKRAEKVGIGLIPSFFWTYTAIPDYLGEHLDSYMDDGSRTMAFLRQYVHKMVVRYKDSPAVWGWEFGNEHSLGVDFPPCKGGYVPACVPSLGTPEARDSVRDRYTRECMLNAMKAFREEIRKYDKTRPIFTGNDVPRYCAWHNAKSDTPYVMDTPEENHEMIKIYESEADTYTARGYYNYAEKDTPNFDPMQYYNLNIKEWPDFIKVYKQWADEDGKPLFVGEFGAIDYWMKDPETPSQCWTRKDDIRAEWQKRFDAIVDNDIQLSAFWVYDYDPQNDGCNVSFDNQRSYVLAMALDANRRLIEKNNK
jgi:Cellulase (glycosyl hydrolase family 5).